MSFDYAGPMESEHKLMDWELVGYKKNRNQICCG